MNYIILLFIWFCSLSFAEQDYLCDQHCTFVLKSESSGQYQFINQAQSKQRFSPYSTFKIPNTLIAIELDLVKDLNQQLSFDKTKYTIQNWWPSNWYESPLKIKQAFEYSAVPIYRQIASDIGDNHMQKYVSQFNYGNADISSGLDTFWLGGSLQISPKEQVEFLQRLYNKKLHVSDRSLILLKEIMLVESTNNYKLYAKTGGGNLSNGKAQGWYVGYVESSDGVFYFALHMQAKSFADLQSKRINIAKKLLSKAGVIE
ncbi:MAG: penicillin-binding transpeptidase domain-containing protein [Marinicellaceae bacterium]